MHNADPAYKSLDAASTRDWCHAIDREEAEKIVCPTCGRRCVYGAYTGPRGEYVAFAECPLGHYEIAV